LKLQLFGWTKWQFAEERKTTPIFFGDGIAPLKAKAKILVYF